MNFKKILIFMLIICIFSINCFSAFALSGYQGYTVFRDGVGLPLLEITLGNEDHAAMMYAPYSDYYNILPVIEASGYGHKVDYRSWSQFMGTDNKFHGVYKPKSAMTDRQRELALSTAMQLTALDIGYTLLDKILPTEVPWDKIDPTEILNLRCDGVVQYCYNYNGISVGRNISSRFALLGYVPIGEKPSDLRNKDMVLITSKVPNTPSYK